MSLSPEQRSRLYVYWGDAALVLDPTKPLPERRRNAAAIFLAGLAWLRYLQLPDKAPERPQFDSSDVSDQLNEEEAQQQNIRYQAEMAAIGAVRLQRTMVRQRDVLIGQLTWLYSRKPFATDELRELTLKTTKDAQLTDLLVKAVEVRIKASK